MAGFDYGAYFGPILPLADALRENDTRCWGEGVEKDKAPHDYVLYLGCNVLRTVALAETIVAILNELGVDFVTLGGPAACCGVIHNRNGDMEVSDGITRQTLEKFEGYQPRAVLIYCPSCHSHMDYALGTAGLSLDVPYLHVTEFIIENLHRLTFRNRVSRRVFLHSHGDNDQALKDARFAREILEAIPGLEIVGGAGGPEWAHDCGTTQINIVGAERHAELVEAQFTDARDAGADTIAALYHSCYRTICPGEATHGTEVVHYTSLLAEALGLPGREELFKPLKIAGDLEMAFDRLSPRARTRGLSDERLRKTLGTHFSK